MGLTLLGALVWQGVTNTEEAAHQQIDRSLDRAIERLRILMRAAAMTVESAERATRATEVNGATLRTVLEMSLAAFEQRPELSYLGLVLPENGEYGNLERTIAGEVLLWLHPGTRPDDAVVRNFMLTGQGFVRHAQSPTNGYDARRRPFYEAALKGPTQGSWLPAYRWIVHLGSSEPLWGFSYVKALRDGDGRLLGVLDADIDMPALNRFLASIAAEYSVQLQVVELGETPRLIGSPRAERVPLPVPGDLVPLLQASGNAFLGRVQFDGEDRWTAARRLELEGGTSWLVVASRPASMIEIPLRHLVYQVATMGLALVLGLVVASVLMARRFGQPLIALERSVAHIALPGVKGPLAFESTPADFRETRRLADALSQMTSALRTREREFAAQTDQLLQAKEQQVAALALKGAIVDSTNAAIFSLDPGLVVIELNTATERMFTVERRTVVGRVVSDVIHAPDGPADWNAMLAIEGPEMFRLVGAQGPFDAELRIIPTMQDGQLVRTLVINDVSARKAAERRLRQERDYVDAVLNSLPGVFYHCDENVRLRRWNRNLERFTGATAEQLSGADPLTFFPPGERALVASKIAEVFEKGETCFEASYVRENGQRVPCLFTGMRFEHGHERGFVGIGTDISERKQAEQRLRYLATHDELTDLPNRNLLRDRLDQAIAHAGRTGRRLALLYLDLDRFKVINDAYGHPFGDDVLKAVGCRLGMQLRAGDTVARHGGDEFLILLTHLHSPSDADTVAAKIVESLRQPIVLEGREIHLSGSLGMSAFPDDGQTAESLISSADLAMYRAKSLGRNTYQSFVREMSEETRQRVHLETCLRGAAAAGQLQLVYQPKVDLMSGRIIGCEALLRWNHPELGSVPPARFIPVAEDSGLIVPISDWVLQTACLQARAWLDAGLPQIAVAVNVSARQILQQDLSTWALTMLQDTGLPAASLELELTESLIAQDVDNVRGMFGRLKTAGVHLSIDDFGTGYSSLSYLKNFQVDTLKIDQSFVRNMLVDPDDATIVRTVIALAHNLKFKVIAEGVETKEHCRMLREQGCDEMQGYYFSKPVPAKEFEAMLRMRRQLHVAD